jgi:lipopolysaccharide transport system permease protein
LLYPRLIVPAADGSTTDGSSASILIPFPNGLHESMPSGRDPRQSPQGRVLIDYARSVFTSFWRHRYLILQLARRDVVGRYRGSVLGIAWSLVNPLLMLGVYSFLFGVVFRSRWDTAGDGGALQYALMLSIGLIVHGIFAECVNRAPTLVLHNTNYVKRVVFPLQILPWTVMASALFHAAVSLIVWLVVALASGMPISPTALWLPLVLVPLVLLTMGLGWALASLGVYLRDVSQTVTLLTTVLLFLSPILYPITAVPAEYRPLIQLNPLTFIVEQARAVLAQQSLPDFRGLALATLQNFLVAVIGLWWFERSRKGFADVV